MDIIELLDEFRERAMNEIKDDGEDNQDYLLLILAIDVCKKDIEIQQFGPHILMMDMMARSPLHDDTNVKALLKVDEKSKEKKIVLTWVSPDELH